MSRYLDFYQFDLFVIFLFVCLSVYLSISIPDNAVMILLSCHVQRGEPILALHVHAGRMTDQNFDDLLLPGQAGNVQRCVSLKSKINKYLILNAQ